MDYLKQGNEWIYVSMCVRMCMCVHSHVFARNMWMRNKQFKLIARGIFKEKQHYQSKERGDTCTPAITQGTQNSWKQTKASLRGGRKGKPTIQEKKRKGVGERFNLKQ